MSSRPFGPSNGLSVSINIRLRDRTDLTCYLWRNSRKTECGAISSSLVWRCAPHSLRSPWTSQGFLDTLGSPSYLTSEHLIRTRFTPAVVCTCGHGSSDRQSTRTSVIGEAVGGRTSTQEATTIAGGVVRHGPLLDGNRGDLGS